MPAEWEPHAATWLAWPHAEGDFFDKLDTVRWTYVEMMRLLTPHERVRLLVPPGQQDLVRDRLAACRVAVERVDLVEQSTDRSWTRDSLPLFVVPRSGAGELAAVKWCFNGWARYPDHQLDDQAGEVVARTYAREVFFPEYRRGAETLRVVLEGGAIDVDGEGTALVTERCLLGAPYQRNPGLAQGELEALLRRYLGVVQLVWLPDGIAGDDTSGHVDDFARFVAPGKVVVCAESASSSANYAPLRRAREVLVRAHDAQGRALDVVELPMPRTISFRGEVLPASYANFYVANGLVLVPTFNDPNDRVALEVLSGVFPSRSVVGVHCTDLVVGLGALHCSTQQEPFV